MWHKRTARGHKSEGNGELHHDDGVQLGNYVSHWSLCKLWRFEALVLMRSYGMADVRSFLLQDRSLWTITEPYLSSSLTVWRHAPSDLFELHYDISFFFGRGSILHMGSPLLNSGSRSPTCFVYKPYS